MPWQATVLRKHETRFVLRGEGVSLRGEVWQGRMDDDLFWGLKSLETPQLNARVGQAHEISVPASFLHRPNTGRDRRVVRVVPRLAGAPKILRFNDIVPPELLRDLRTAFSKESPHAQVTDRPLDGAPDGGQADLQGPDHADDRNPPEDRLDPGLRQGRQKVAARRKPVRRKKKARS